MMNTIFGLKNSSQIKKVMGTSLYALIFLILSLSLVTKAFANEALIMSQEIVGEFHGPGYSGVHVIGGPDRVHDYKPPVSPTEMIGNLASEGGVFTSQDKSIQLEASELTVYLGENFQFSVSPLKPTDITASVPEGMKIVSNIIEFIGPPGTIVRKPIKISVKYKPEMAAVDVFPYYLNESTDTWQLIQSLNVDKNTKTVTFETTHFSKYAVMGKPVVATRSFDDIAKHWAKADIEYVAAKGIVTGKSGNLFDPDGKVTRAEFARMLVDALGLTLESGQNTFVDVQGTAWYYKWVETAAKAGITAGSNGSFRPDARVTRQEMAVMIVKALAIKNKTLTGDPNGLDKFEDITKVSNWAKDGMTRAVTAKIVNGKSFTKLAPLDNATRAEAAVVIKKILTKLST